MSVTAKSKFHSDIHSRASFFLCVCLLVLIVPPACITNKTVNIEYVNRPVLLGMQNNIAEPTKSEQAQRATAYVLRQSFSFELASSMSYTTLERGSRFEAGILRLVDSPQDTIRVKEVQFGSSSYLIPSPGVSAGDVRSFIEISGGIYGRSETEGHDKRR
jgi:hypothetical protein